MLKTAFVAARDRRRLQVIAGVLIGYGFSKVVDRLGLHHIARFASRATPKVDVTRLSRPQRVRLAIEALGPTFIKFGQILASRPDLLTPQWTEELGKLHSQVSPVPWEHIRSQIEADLGGDPHEIFAEFNTTPIASASIAQVYRARLQTGEDVVVKILRPGLRKIIEADLRLMAHGSRLVESEWPEMARYKPQEQMRHLAHGINGELDLANEGRNCELLASLFSARDDVMFPKIYWEWTSERVLVQEFMHGIFLNDYEGLNNSDLDKTILAQKGTDAFLQMALIEGVFHADPHPGNILALPGNKIAFIDFGIIGRLSQRRRDQLLVLIGSMLKKDADGLMAVLLEWSGVTAPDLAKLEASSQAFVMRHSGAVLNLGLVLTDFMTMARENDLAMPTDLAVLFKGLITADGVMRQLDPKFDLFTAAGPTVQKTIDARFSFSGFKKKLESVGAGLFTAASDLPSLVHLMLVRLKQGRMTVEIEIKGMDKLVHGIERAAARVAVALVVAAFSITLAPRLIDLGKPAVATVSVIVSIIGLGWLVLLSRKK
ncbi:MULTISPECIES: ABC1 kinase family protein [Lichenihabitans]|uniref:ABC1 kinase family protein n=1 Tax=Lichenihabitans TaxID=2723776 RepID=UPI001035FF48|nr:MULTISPECIES: AarF/UbiB family protein [Lichenihabitans]UDL94838.1 ABC transporter [Lichenihabitans sp. PAMC28606]